MKRIINEDGILFGKVSIIDVLIVLVIVSGIAGAWYKFNNNVAVTPFTEKDKLEVTFYIESVPEYSIAAINVGDKVIDEVTGAYIGTVQELESGNSIDYVWDDDGRIVASTKPGYKYLKVRVHGEGTVTESGIKFGGAEYLIGTKYYIKLGKSGGLNLMVSKLGRLEE